LTKDGGTLKGLDSGAKIFLFFEGWEISLTKRCKSHNACSEVVVWAPRTNLKKQLSYPTARAVAMREIRYPQSKVQWYRESAPTHLNFGDTGSRSRSAGMTAYCCGTALEGES